jgi:hypothetical protein
MEKNSTTDAAPLFAGEAWFDPIEAELRERVRGFLEEMIEEEATAALGRSRYQRGSAAGYRNGTRSRRLLGSFGPVVLAVPRARLLAPDGTSREWRSAVLPRYARMTRQVEALIASAYAWKKQLQEHAARAFDPKVGQEAEVQAEREIERLHAKIGQLTIENDFFGKRFGR